MGDSIFPNTKRTRSQVVLPESLLQQVSLSRSPLKDARLARRNQNQTGVETSTDSSSHRTELGRVAEADQEDDELLLSPKKPLQLGDKRSPSPSAIADRPSMKRFKSNNSDSDIENKTHVRHYSDSNALPRKSPRKRSATTSGTRKMNSATSSRHQSPALPTKERARSVPVFPSATSFPTIDLTNPPASPTRSPRSRSRTPAKFEPIFRMTSGPFVSQSRSLGSISNEAETADDRAPNPATVTFAIAEEPCTPRQPYAFSIPMSPLTPLPETPHPNKLLATGNAAEDRYTASEGWLTGADHAVTTSNDKEVGLRTQNLDPAFANRNSGLSDTTGATTTITTRSRLPLPTRPNIPSSEKDSATSSSKRAVAAPSTSTTTTASRRAAAGKTPGALQKRNAFQILMTSAKIAGSKSEKGKGKEDGMAPAGSSKAVLKDGGVSGATKKEKGKAKASVEVEVPKVKSNSIKSKMKPKEKNKGKEISTPRAVVIESEDEENLSGEEQREQHRQYGFAGKDVGQEEDSKSHARPSSPAAGAPPESSSSLTELNDYPLVADDAILRMDDGPVGMGDEEDGTLKDDVMHEVQTEQQSLSESNAAAAAPSPLFSEADAPSPLFTDGELDQETTEPPVLSGDLRSTTNDMDTIDMERTEAPASQDIAMEDAPTIGSGSDSLQPTASAIAPLDIEPAPTPTENVDEAQTPTSSAAHGKGTKGRRQRRVHPPPVGGSRVTRSASGRKPPGRSGASVPAPTPRPTENASETDTNLKEQATGNATESSTATFTVPSTSAPVSPAVPEPSSSDSPLFTPDELLTPAPMDASVGEDAEMVDAVPEAPSPNNTMDPMSLPEYDNDVNSVSSLSDLPSEMEDADEDNDIVHAEDEKNGDSSQATKQDIPMGEVAGKGSACEKPTELVNVQVQPEPILSSKSKRKAKALVADAPVRRSPRDRKGTASTATSTASRPTRSSLAKTTTSSIPVTPARAKAALPKVPSVVLDKSRSVPSPSKLGKSASMFITRPIGHTDMSSLPRTSQGGIVKGDTKALNVLESALEKLRMPPPSRPNTSMGFNRDDDSDTSLEIAVKSKDDGAIGRGALGLGRPSALQRSSSVFALEKSSSGASSSSSTSKPRSLVQGQLSMFMPVGTGPGLNGPRRAGAIMRGGRSGAGAVKHLPIGPGINPFGSGRGQKASQKTSLPSVMASPVKGGGALADTDADVSMADVNADTEAQGHVDVDLTMPDSSVLEGEDKGPMDLSELQTTSASDKGKGKASDELPKKSNFKRASLAAVAFSQSLSALPTQTPTSTGSMGPPATPPRREGLRSSSSNYPHSSKVGTAEDEGSSKAKPKSNILQDCKVFVDVRSEDGEDVASWFIDALKDLGARIMTRVGPTCTHIVFKDGLLSTINRYRTLNDPKPSVVGITWIVECLEQLKHADESRFLIDLEDFKFSGTHKRRKSMIPKLIPQVLDDNQSIDGDISMDGSNTSINEDDLPPLARARLRQSMLLSARS